MASKIKLLYKYFIFFLLGGSIYFTIELLFRGYSHYTMFAVGGICYILIGLINEYFPWDMYFELQAIIGGLIVTLLEFIAGCILNLWLGLGIWDYSNLPLNILGQICIPFTAAWVGISIVAILLDDWVRYKAFNEEKPRYRSFFYEMYKKIEAN